MPQTVRSSIDIDAPPEVVWDVANDPATFETAIDWVHEARWEGEPGVRDGAVYVERAKPGIREGTYRWEIAGCDPPRRVVHRHRSGEIDAELLLEFTPLAGERTRYTQTMTFRGLPAFRPLGLVIERIAMKPQMQRDFDEMILPNVKRLVEERHPRGG